VFEKAFEGLVIDRMEGNEEIFTRLMSDTDFRQIASDHILQQVYHSLKKGTDSDDQPERCFDEEEETIINDRT